MGKFRDVACLAWNQQDEDFKARGLKQLRHELFVNVSYVLKSWSDFWEIPVMNNQVICLGKSVLE